jgi:hypothetical protein
MHPLGLWRSIDAIIVMLRADQNTGGRMRTNIHILALIVMTVLATETVADTRTGHQLTSKEFMGSSLISTNNEWLIDYDSAARLSLKTFKVGDNQRPSRLYHRGGEFLNSTTAQVVFACSLRNASACRIYNQVASTVHLPPLYTDFNEFARSVTTPRDPAGEPADPLAVAKSYK